MITILKELIAPLVALVLVLQGTIAGIPSDSHLAAIPTTPPTVSIRADGTILINGQATFLHGFYHDSDIVPRWGQEIRDDVDVIANAGFNLMKVSVDPTYDNRASLFLEKARQREMYVISSVYLPSLQVVTKAFNNLKSPILLGIDAGDDFNSPVANPKYSPTVMKNRHTQIKSINQNLLSYGSGGGHPNYPLSIYKGAMDITGVQIYPFGDGSQSVANELEASDDYMTRVRQDLGPNTPVIPNLQSFTWATRWPTSQELRNQLFTVLQHDVQGILWYTYHQGDSGWLLDKANPTLWTELDLLADEVKQLAPILTDGQYTKVDPTNNPYFNNSQGTWHAAYWQYQGKVYVIVTNTHKTQSQNVAISLPSGIWQAAKLFNGSRYGGGLTVQGNQLTGTIAAAGVDVYVLNTASDATSPLSPTNASATAVSSSQIDLTWSPATDNVAVTGYKIYKAGIQIATISSTTSYQDVSLSPSTSYSYTVAAYDAAGNTSLQSNSASATTKTNPDTVIPVVSIATPSNNTVVSNSITVSATASDPVVSGGVTSGLANVVFKVDESVLATDTASPFTTTLDTKTLSNGSHTVTARAADNVGNLSTIASVTLIVNNLVAPTIPTKTLTAALSASPNNATAPVSGISLTAALSGTATGNSNYYFYCNRNDTSLSTSTTPDLKYTNDRSTSKSTSYLCSYAKGGIYTAKVIVERNGLVSESRTNITILPGISFTKDLSLGDRGDDVKMLQIFLNAQGFTVSSIGQGSKGKESTYFGLSTRNALKKFQTSAGIVPADGNFQLATRLKIEALLK